MGYAPFDLTGKKVLITGGNSGIGSTTGFSSQTMLIIAGVVLVGFLLFRKK